MVLDAQPLVYFSGGGIKHDLTFAALTLDRYKRRTMTSYEA
jgi:hypothetical protein